MLMTCQITLDGRSKPMLPNVSQCFLFCNALPVHGADWKGCVISYYTKVYMN